MDGLKCTADPPPAFDQAPGAKWCDLCTEAREGGTHKFDVNLSCALLQAAIFESGF